MTSPDNNTLPRMTVLVMGGTGHTGERVVRRLLADGHAVRVYSRRDPATDGVLSALVRAEAEARPGDARNAENFAAALAGCDALISCAHIRYARFCVDACGRAGVLRYLQMSSTRRFTKFPCTSQREVIEGEEVIVRSSLDYTILRPTMIFGGQRDANMERMVQWFRRHRWFPLFGDGTNLVQPVFVEDLVEAIVRALYGAPLTVRKTYTIAGPEPITYRQLLEETARACGVKRLRLLRVPQGLALTAAKLAPRFLARRGLTAEQVQRFAEDKTADIADARRDLEFAPRPFPEAIAIKARGGAD